jgi:twitching motility protein PilT
MAHDIDEMLVYASEKKASDLFIKANAKPAIRVNGRIADTPFPELSIAEAHELCLSKMTPRQIAIFEQHHEMDLAFAVGDKLRIRMNVYSQRGHTASVLRLIPTTILSLEELGIPPKVKEFCVYRNGLVLVTGPTGSGKTTTLAAMIDLINQNRRVNIITIEDPIEFVHPDKQAIVSQREIGMDTDNFSMALRHILRQAPDIILIGEMRDVETMNTALQASETGHLVFATVHTASCAETLDRISNMFPPHERPMLWLRLSVSLRGVLSQKLIPRADGTGRVAAVELMDVTPTIVKMLEEGKSDEIYTAIRQAGTDSYWGMQTMNQCLVEFFRKGLITEQDALASAGNVTEIRQMLRGAVQRGEVEGRAGVESSVGAGVPGIGSPGQQGQQRPMQPQPQQRPMQAPQVPPVPGQPRR